MNGARSKSESGKDVVFLAHMKHVCVSRIKITKDFLVCLQEV